MNQYANFNENIKAVICQNIKKYRNEKGVRLMELAEKLDVSNVLSQLMIEKTYHFMTLYKISIILGVRIDKFFEE